MDVSSGEQRVLTSPPTGDRTWDVRPVFSPDGKTLAFVRQRFTTCEIYLMPLGHSPRRLAAPGLIFGLDWTADSREIVYSLFPEPESELWRIPVDGGPARRSGALEQYRQWPH